MKMLHILWIPQKADSTAALDEVPVLEPNIIEVSHTIIFVGDTYSSGNWGNSDTNRQIVTSIVHVKVSYAYIGGC